MIAFEIILAGVIIFSGFFARYLFDKTRIPDVIFLMLLGTFLAHGIGVLDAAAFIPLAPLLGAVALAVILFDGGLNLKLARIAGELSSATVFTLAVFALTVIGVGAGMHLFFNWDLFFGLLLGAAVGGTGAAVVISMMDVLTVKDETKTLLVLESVITSSLCIVTALAVIDILTNASLDTSRVLGSIAAAYSTSLVIAVAAGIAWLATLEKLHGKRFGYMLTLGAVFLVYASAAFFKGNGAVAALAFGLVVGNAQLLRPWVGKNTRFEVKESIQKFQSEVTFFVRTFFFVYLGILFDPRALNADLAVKALFVVAVILAARLAIVRILRALDKRFRHDVLLTVGLVPRGTAPAVLASLPVAYGLFIPSFAELSFATIMLTNLLATATAFLFGTRAQKALGVKSPARQTKA